MNCTRCGKCCKEELCQVGEILFKTISPPCPALRLEKEIAICALIEVEIFFNLEPILQTNLGVGKGCSYNHELPF